MTQTLTRDRPEQAPERDAHREQIARQTFCRFVERGIRNLELAGVDLENDDEQTALRKVEAWVDAGRPGESPF